MIFSTTICCGSSGEGGGGTDLSNLLYANDDWHAGALGIALKGYYLASEFNNLGVKYGTVLRREL